MSHFCFLHLKFFSCSNLASSAVLFTIGSVGPVKVLLPVTAFSEFLHEAYSVPKSQSRNTAQGISLSWELRAGVEVRCFQDINE